jgi:hypothetical protein
MWIASSDPMHQSSLLAFSDRVGPVSDLFLPFRFCLAEFPANGERGNGF